MDRKELIRIARARVDSRAPLPQMIEGMQWKGTRKDTSTLGKVDLIRIAVLKIRSGSGWLRKSRLAMYRQLSCLNKKELVAIISIVSGISAFKRLFRVWSMKQDYPMKQDRVYDNEICPFTQEVLEQPVFVRTSSTGYHRGFSLESLIGYINATGKYHDPIDKEELSSADLLNIDRLKRTYMIDVRDVHDIKAPHRQHEFKQRKILEESKELFNERIEILIHNVALDIRNHDSTATLVQTDFRSFYEFRAGCGNFTARLNTEDRRDVFASCRQKATYFMGRLSAEQYQYLIDFIARTETFCLGLPLQDAGDDIDTFVDLPHGVFADDILEDPDNPFMTTAVLTSIVSAIMSTRRVPHDLAAIWNFSMR